MIRLSPVLMPIVQPLVQGLTSTPVPADTTAKPDLLANLRICLHTVAGAEGFVRRLDAQFARLQTDPSLDLEPLFAMELKTLVDPLAGIFLFVDDESEVLTAVSRLFRSSLGLSEEQVRLAFNGAEALKVFDEIGPVVSAVISDIDMPLLGGIQLYRELRGRDFRGPVVLLSGMDHDEELGPILAADPLTAFLPKPFGMAELCEVIRSRLQTDRERDQSEAPGR